MVNTSHAVWLNYWEFNIGSRNWCFSAKESKLTKSLTKNTVYYYSVNNVRMIIIDLTWLYFCVPPQEQISNGIQGCASLSSSSTVLIGSYSVDREALKRLGIGLALAAAVLAFILEKVFWCWICGPEEDCEHGRARRHQRKPWRGRMQRHNNVSPQIIGNRLHGISLCLKWTNRGRQWHQQSPGSCYCRLF